MTPFALRFVAAGLLVALLPLIAERFTIAVAGLVLLFPIVTLVGFAVVGSQGGSAAVASASAGSLSALPAVSLFLLTVHIAARRDLGVALPLTLGLAVWFVAASLTLLLNDRLWER